MKRWHGVTVFLVMNLAGAFMSVACEMKAHIESEASTPTPASRGPAVTQVVHLIGGETLSCIELDYPHDANIAQNEEPNYTCDNITIPKANVLYIEDVS